MLNFKEIDCFLLKLSQIPCGEYLSADKLDSDVGSAAGNDGKEPTFSFLLGTALGSFGQRHCTVGNSGP